MTSNKFPDKDLLAGLLPKAPALQSYAEGEYMRDTTNHPTAPPVKEHHLNKAHAASGHEEALESMIELLTMDLEKQGRKGFGRGQIINIAVSERGYVSIEGTFASMDDPLNPVPRVEVTVRGLDYVRRHKDLQEHI